MDHDNPAEKALIGEALCTLPDFDLGPTFDRISPNDFADRRHQTIWGAMGAIQASGKRPTLPALDEHLKTTGATQTAGGPDYLAELLETINQLVGLDESARLVWEAASRRRIAAEARLCAEAAAGEGGSLKAAGGRLRALVDSLEQRETAREPVLDGWSCLVREYEREALPALQTGFSQLDELVQFSPGRLYVVGGRPGSGKTTLTLQIALQALSKYEEAHALFVSCEMGPGELVKQALCTLSGRDFLTPFTAKASAYDKGKALADAGDGWESLLKRLHLTYSRSIDDANNAARRLIAAGFPLRVVVIDYISAMTAPGSAGAMDNRSREVGAVSRLCKSMAQDLGLVVFAPSQLNRSSAGSNPRAPVLSDLRDSGEVEQDADAVLLLYREDMEDPDALADLIVAKNRWGQLGAFKLRPELSKHRFRD